MSPCRQCVDRVARGSQWPLAKQVLARWKAEIENKGYFATNVFGKTPNLHPDCKARMVQEARLDLMLYLMERHPELDTEPVTLLYSCDNVETSKTRGIGLTRGLPSSCRLFHFCLAPLFAKLLNNAKVINSLDFPQYVPMGQEQIYEGHTRRCPVVALLTLTCQKVKETIVPAGTLVVYDVSKTKQHDLFPFNDSTRPWLGLRIGYWPLKEETYTFKQRMILFQERFRPIHDTGPDPFQAYEKRYMLGYYDATAGSKEFSVEPTKKLHHEKIKKAHKGETMDNNENEKQGVANIYNTLPMFSEMDGTKQKKVVESGQESRLKINLVESKLPIGAMVEHMDKDGMLPKLKRNLAVSETSTCLGRGQENSNQDAGEIPVKRQKVKMLSEHEKEPIAHACWEEGMRKRRKENHRTWQHCNQSVPKVTLGNGNSDDKKLETERHKDAKSDVGERQKTLIKKNVKLDVGRKRCFVQGSILPQKEGGRKEKIHSGENVGCKLRRKVGGRDVNGNSKKKHFKTDTLEELTKNSEVEIIYSKTDTEMPLLVSNSKEPLKLQKRQLVNECEDCELVEYIPPQQESRIRPKNQMFCLTAESESRILKGKWLDADAINVAQQILRDTFQMKGFQPTTLAESLNFEKMTEPFVQILFDKDRFHWLCISSQHPPNQEGSHIVNVYDSLCNGRVSPCVAAQIKAIVGNFKEKNLVFPPVQQQLNNVDCGVFAIAFATHAASGRNPAGITYNMKTMRRHLLECLKSKKLYLFHSLDLDWQEIEGKVANLAAAHIERIYGSEARNVDSLFPKPKPKNVLWTLRNICRLHEKKTWKPDTSRTIVQVLQSHKRGSKEARYWIGLYGAGMAGIEEFRESINPIVREQISFIHFMSDKEGFADAYQCTSGVGDLFLKRIVFNYKTFENLLPKDSLYV